MSTNNLRPPAPIRWAGFIAITQSLIGIGYAVLLIIRQILGYRDPAIVSEQGSAASWVGTGTAIYFLVIFGIVIIAAIRMIRGHTWGRGLVVMLQMILLPIAWYMGSSHAFILCAVTGLSAIAGLVLLFHPVSVKWVTERY
ncbi:hypothetical protein GSS88_03645 [Corynebacterium sp. 3HC-13]|uniref:hypothetical protein n=1 Tax=Corynebacterium poyangense TaxID=2684405 RepID=UPI001CCAE3E8|nr:hypothetical protein [Corynebacterium poyangense]MBZ8176895.1 hypothetical protein [Corynebacterium poyangense]